MIADRNLPPVKGALRWTVLPTALACVVLLTLLGHKPLTDWDEAIYAEVSREMLTRGWLVPHWNGQVWLEKPPLLLWITAAFFKLFGVSEFWARAASAFSGVAIVALLHRWLLPRGGQVAAWLGTVILLSTFGFLHVARVGETDVLLSLGCALALCGLAEVQRHSLTGWYLFWGGCAVATMTKGAGCIVLPLTLAVLAGWERWRADRFGRHFWCGLLLALAGILPWHLLMFRWYRQQFLTEYLGYHVLARAGQALEGHRTHGWYYLWVILVSAMPWALLYPFAVVAALRRTELRAWAVFALVVVGFYSVVQTRLPHYIAPAYPALAVLTAMFLADRLSPLLKARPPVRTWAAYAGVSLVLGIGSILLTAKPRGLLHRARDAGGRIVPGDKEAALLLRDSLHHLPPVSGPLLLWWPETSRSIATSVFYARRDAQQVQVLPPDLNKPRDKYTFNPVALDEAVTSEPRLLLLDKTLLPHIPVAFRYDRIASGSSMELGTIQRR